MNAINPHKAELLLQESNYLISLPEVCLKLKKVLSDPFHNIADIAEIIMHDPGLVTRLLRIVNSAYYGLASPATDITQALRVLGEKDLNNLVVVTSIVKTMGSIDSKVDLKQFWKSSIFCAVTARNIAQECLKKNKEELFVAGLLLKVGRLLIFHHEPELLQTIKDETLSSGRQDYLIEQEILGFDHAQVGAMMAKSWNFSPLLEETIQTHLNFPTIDNSSSAQCIIYLTNYCAEILHFNLDKMETIEELNLTELTLQNSEILAFLSISNDSFISLLQQSYEEYFTVYESFLGAT